MMSPHVRSASTRRTWIAVFAVITLALLGGGYWYYREEAKEIRREEYQTIAAIGELKAGQIEQWRKERLANADRMARDRFLEQAIAELLREPDHQNRRADIRDRLEFERMDGRYDNAILLAPDGKILIAVGDALRHGVFDKTAHFIGKPYAVAELARKVREVLNERG
jgi:hypothetical protein